MNENTAKLIEILKKNKKTLTTAESCTGGMIASEITSVSGASSVFEGGFVTYSERIKEEFLGVSPDVISKNGVVSKEVALEMAIGAAKKASADISVAVTGVAGPTGGSEENPVGTVWFGIATAKKAFARKFIFEGTRQEIRTKATYKAIELLLEGTQNI